MAHTGGHHRWCVLLRVQCRRMSPSPCGHESQEFRDFADMQRRWRGQGRKGWGNTLVPVDMRQADPAPWLTGAIGCKVPFGGQDWLKPTWKHVGGWAGEWDVQDHDSPSRDLTSSDPLCNPPAHMHAQTDSHGEGSDHCEQATMAVCTNCP